LGRKTRDEKSDTIAGFFFYSLLYNVQAAFADKNCKGAQDHERRIHNNARTIHRGHSLHQRLRRMSIPLTENGIQLAEKASHDSRLEGVEIIISSPYTRAMQTAAIISKNRNLDIRVEIGLHEWIPDFSFQYSTEEDNVKAEELCTKFKGVCPKDCEIQFENFEDVFNRAKTALLQYSNYKKILVISHSVVIRRFVSYPNIPHCGIIEICFDESCVCTEFDYC